MAKYILPLYSFLHRSVQEHSGLNQGYSAGRHRDFNEVYIPIPQAFYDHYGEEALPDRGVQFQLVLPSGDLLNAKVCQDNRKALMSNPNASLGKWIFFELGIDSNQLVTNVDLTNAGFDSVILENNGDGSFNISRCLEKNKFQQEMGREDIF